MNTNIVICGCVKDCELYIPKVFENIKEICNKYNVIKIVVAYDNSRDKTLLELCKLKRTMPIEILINKELLTSVRTQNICNARNKLMDYMENLNKDTNISIDYFMMMDFDDVCSKPINMDTLENAFVNKEKWDSITFHNERYYDYWALSFDAYVYSCWHNSNPKNMIRFMHNDFIKKLSNTQEELMECKSSFNGFGIYNFNKYRNIRYQSKIDLSLFDVELLKTCTKKTGIKPIIRNDIYDCEHRYFHYKASSENGAKHFISKQHLFPPYIGEHARFLYT